ncbi:hypothetical protein DRJ17_05105 [Candidatus Woesearchaeota archaeon]|nr:MAG: hypothetical protein DRJ17_05105 [Candidatus Woesearchaeota archaeon]
MGIGKGAFALNKRTLQTIGTVIGTVGLPLLDLVFDHIRRKRGMPGNETHTEKSWGFSRKRSPEDIRRKAKR